jgi:uncharacterized membrane protein
MQQAESRTRSEWIDARSRAPREATRARAISHRGPEDAESGWFSLGLGMAAAVAPGAVAQLAGVSLDRRTRTVITAASVVAAGVVALAHGIDRAKRHQRAGHGSRSVAVGASITINRSPGEVYRFWRNLSNLPAFMLHVESVRESAGHSYWQAKGPVGSTFEWEAEITDDRPEQRIAWRSSEGADVPNHGSVAFVAEPRGVGTEVHVELAFEPPGGALGAGLARLFDELPEQWLRNDLRRLKQILETGEVVRSDASVHRGPHPARPPKPNELSRLSGKVSS